MMNERNTTIPAIDSLDQDLIRTLGQKALAMRQFSYIPYSHFAVGAALLTESGEIFTGCNIENAAYGPSNCAERTAFFKAVSEGHQKFRAIAIAGGSKDREPEAFCPPCGVCLQVMMEFCQPDSFEIWLVRGTGASAEDYRMVTLRQLLPEGFGPGNLE